MLFCSSKSRTQTVYIPGQEIKIRNQKADFAFAKTKAKPSVFKIKILGLISVFALFYIVICIHLFRLCTSDNLIGKKTFASTSNKTIKRTDIIDRNGNILATSLPITSLAKRGKIENPELVASELCEILNEDECEDILAKLKKESNYMYIKRTLTPTQIYQINALGHHELEFEMSQKRIYPYKNIFSHLLGYTDIDNNAIAGLEKNMDKIIISSDIPLKLSLDLVIQDIVHQELSAAVEKFKAVGGVAILMDVNTSKIISMVSLPDFNPNNRDINNNDALKNFATEGLYEAGSVFKVFNSALGLNTGKITLNEKFDTTKDFKVRGRWIKGYHEIRTFQTVREILINSSNIGSAKIALKVGAEDQKEFLRNLGFFKKVPNIEVAEKGHPILPPKQWADDTVATISYGYGISITPLHLITAFSAIVNGGIYNEPTILENGPERKSHRVISQTVSENMRSLLRSVVTDGTAKFANVAGYQVGGKTGTANKIINGRYEDNKLMSTFISAFPITNPQYALLITLNEPKGIPETHNFATAGWNAVPTSGKIIERIAPLLNIQADFLLEEQKKHIIEASYH